MMTHPVPAELDTFKSEFIATAAHKLRTPLASIHGFAELLLQQELDENTRKEFLGIIFEQSRQMSIILNELLEMHKGSTVSLPLAADSTPAADQTGRQRAP